MILHDNPVDWHAYYAWSQDRGGHGLTVRYFRLALDLVEVPESLLIHVTADSRYRLWVNGQPLGRGPVKGMLQRYFVDTYELAPHLAVGRNVLAAEVRWFGDHAPTAEVHSRLPGFLVHAPNHAGLDTPGQWKVWVDRAVVPDTTPYHQNAQHFLNHTELVDLRLRPREWWRPEFNDEAWAPAERLGAPVNASARWGVADLRALVPRDMPALLEEPRRFRRTIVDHAVVPHVFGAAPQPWRLAAGEGGVLILDADAQTTGYPVLEFRGGRDRTVYITYAEAMGFPTGHLGRHAVAKGQRDDLRGEPLGYRDTVVLSGAQETWEPFHWHAFWFMKIEILPGSEPVEVVDAHYRFCTFPQVRTAEFSSSDPEAQPMCEISWRTLQLCSHETYEDCPYYEQLNYIADTRLAALTSFHLANDPRLARRCLALFRDSLRSNGLIGARVPSEHPQMIPYFCLLWVQMLDDYWQWVGPQDREFVRTCLPVMDHILVFFRERLRPDGFIGKVPHWNMVDRQPGWMRGEPPTLLAGDSTYLTSLYAQALATAIGLHEAAGREEDAIRWKPLLPVIRRAVRTLAWSPSEGLFLEGSRHPHEPFSQHTQAAVINAGIATAAQCRRIARRLTNDPTLLRVRYMQSFYLARALEHIGRYHEFHTHVLAPWRAMLADRTSTWWEYPAPTRSDCHAWSGWVAVDFFRCVLGARPARPGWTAIQLAPQTGGLQWAGGQLATPAGLIRVDWRKEGAMLRFSAHTPAGVPVFVQLPGAAVQHFPEGGTIELNHLLATPAAQPPVAVTSCT